MNGAGHLPDFVKKHSYKSIRSILSRAGTRASAVFVICILTFTVRSGPAFRTGPGNAAMVYAAEVFSASDADPAEIIQDQTQGTQAEQGEETQEAQEAQNGEEESGSGRYFVNKTHIIISCVVAFALAVLIAVLQANKKFK